MEVAYLVHEMSSNEDETNAASVLSQMSKSTKQASENVTTQQIDNNSVIAHQCDIETTSSQGKLSVPYASGTMWKESSEVYRTTLLEYIVKEKH